MICVFSYYMAAVAPGFLHLGQSRTSQSAAAYVPGLMCLIAGACESLLLFRSEVAVPKFTLSSALVFS